MLSHTLNIGEGWGRKKKVFRSDGESKQSSRDKKKAFATSKVCRLIWQSNKIRSEEKRFRGSVRACLVHHYISPVSTTFIRLRIIRFDVTHRRWSSSVIASWWGRIRRLWCERQPCDEFPSAGKRCRMRNAFPTRFSNGWSRHRTELYQLMEFPQNCWVGDINFSKRSNSESFQKV